MKSKVIVWFVMIFLLLAFVPGILWASTKLTYIEYVELNSSRSEYILAERKNDTVIQEFTMPYSILNNFSIIAKQFDRYNASIWEVSLVYKKSQEVLFQGECAGYELWGGIDMGRNIRVVPNEVYQVVITAKEVNSDSSIGFYITDKDVGITEYGGKCTFNGVLVDGNINLILYGGEPDFWWIGLIVFTFAIMFFTLARAFYLLYKKQSVLSDATIQMVLLGLFIFGLKYPFAYITGCFNDELEHLYAGHVILNGGVMYRDYISQHTPLLQYICAFFALLGADSEAQLRISYYIFEALIWGFIYHRFSVALGQIRILLISVFTVIAGAVISYLSSTSVLADNAQALFVIVLLLEFFVYIKDRKITWDRCAVVSLSFWSGVGVAFVSVFSTISVIIIVMLLEFGFLGKQNRVPVKMIMARYLKLIIIFLTPPFLFVFYFVCHHSFIVAFKQMYLFNTQVYSKYTGGYGTSIIQPFILGIKNMMKLFYSTWYGMFEGNISINEIMIFILQILLICSLILLVISKKNIEAFALILTISFSASRGCDTFHSAPVWTVIIFSITYAVTEKISQIHFKRGYQMIFGVLALLFMYKFVPKWISGCVYRQEPISVQQKYVIDATEVNDSLFIDVTCAGDCLYYLYKGRTFANRLVFIHPWFLEWFEDDLVNDLREKEPPIVIFNDSNIVWLIPIDAPKLVEELKNNYSKLSDDPEEGWKYYTWIRNSAT